MRLIPAMVSLGVLLCAISAWAPAHSMNGSPPEQGDAVVTVDQVLEHHLRAIGGAAAFDKIDSRVMKGTYALPTKGYSTRVEVYAKAPNKYAFYMSGAGSTAARGFNGSLGWSRNYAEEGLRVLTGEELKADQREADFYRERNLRALYPTMTLKGKQQIEGHEAYAVQATSSDGSSETLYFDVATGLIVRRDLPVYFSLRNVEVYFDNYKVVDGIMLPFVVRIVRKTAPFMTVFAFDTIKHNVKVSDAKFEKPKTP